MTDTVTGVRIDIEDPTRVRLVGIGLVLAGAHLVYHGGVRPA